MNTLFINILLLVVITFFLVALVVVGSKRSELFHDPPPITEKDVTLVFSNDFPSSPKEKQWLCVYSQFKNEKHVILEWIYHYFQEGADHIILVDNGSNDGYDVSALETIPNLTLFSTTVKHRQTEMARFLFKEWVEPHFTWAVNLDMDEFLYSRKFPSLSDYLRVQSVENPSLKAVVVPWKCFGSSGRKSQPTSVVFGFLYRDHDFPLAKNANLVKTLFKPQYYTLKAHTVHSDDMALQKHPHTTMEGLAPTSKKEYRMWHLFEEKSLDLESAHLHLNHYQVQSQDFWTRVKMTRGDADHHGWDHMRNLHYFYQRDKNLVLDDELLHKKLPKKPNLLLFCQPGHTSKEKEWRQRYGNVVGNMFFVVTDPPYHDVVTHYLSVHPSKVLVVCPALHKNRKQLDFVLCRTLVTGKPVFPQVLKGFPAPSPDVYALSSVSHDDEKEKEYHIPYDGKVWTL